MGVLGAPGPRTVPTQPEPEPIPDEAFVEEVADTEFVPASAMLTHVAGSEWTVNYYKQYLEPDSSGTSQSLDGDDVLQQYIEVRNYVIKVQSALEPSQSDTTGEFEVVGEGTILPPLRPNVGDMFVADIGDGKVGIFTIKTIRRLSIYQESAYAVTYRLTDYLTPEREADLKSKTVDKRFYHEDRLEYSNQPALVEEDHHTVESFKEWIPELIEAHYVEFFNKEDKTLLIDIDGKRTYDPALVKAWNSMVSNDTLRNRPRPIELQCTTGEDVTASTVWDSLLKLDNGLLHLASIQYRILSPGDFLILPVFGSIALTTIEKIVWGRYELTNKEHMRGIKSSQLVAGDTSPAPAIYEGPENITVYPLDIDTYYVFSKPFYDGDRTSMSMIELELTKCFSGEALSIANLLTLANQSKDWTPVERFYSLPVLVVLMRVAMRSL
jgi:hypothetical protein